ncbi:hypothetical protein [Nocardioides convexus]|uniref:hypothetical protein n=1 Tax=Nocardioides convexus TaxID=2712224 RepID=UPI0031010954
MLDPLSLQVSGPADGSTLATVAAWCADHDVLPESLSLGQRNLEDVFLESHRPGGLLVTIASTGTFAPAPGGAPVLRQSAHPGRDGGAAHAAQRGAACSSPW